MKAMLLMRPPGEPLRQDTPVVVVPDSALLRTGRPWFVPPFAPRWTLWTVLLLRMSRLGRYIPAKFADRYYDAMTLGVMPRPTPRDPANGMLDAFDGALLLGDWTALPADGFVAAYTPAGTASLGEELAATAPEAVAHLSEYATIKTGDIVGLTTFLPLADPTINTHWEGGINGDKLLSFNVK